MSPPARATEGRLQNPHQTSRLSQADSDRTLPFPATSRGPRRGGHDLDLVFSKIRSADFDLGSGDTTIWVPGTWVPGTHGSGTHGFRGHHTQLPGLGRVPRERKPTTTGQRTFGQAPLSGINRGPGKKTSRRPHTPYLL